VVVLVLAVSNLVLWQQVQQLHPASQAARFTTIALAGTNVDPQAQGLIVMSNNGKYGTLVVENLPALDVNHQYQLWLIQNGQRTNGGTFSVPQNGYTSMWIDTEQPLSSFTSFGITIEPVGGSPEPTGESVLSGSL
jgi:anti-sigma-K factor RskA